MRIQAASALMMMLLGTACGDDDDKMEESSTRPSIAVSPLDVAHITAVSKFRSCSGHDFSPGVKGHGSPDAERARSMKHYLKTDITLTPAGQVQVVAPIDGTIDIQNETFDLGKQVYVTSGNWSLRIFHIDPTVADGAVVKAGDVIGTIAPADAATKLGDQRGPDGKPPTYEFDIAVTSRDNQQYVSIFEMMDPAVAAQWAARGFTRDNTMISKADRDAMPCALGPDGERFADQSENPADWVTAL
ncbi:MAG TPA: hypothetical protein VI299_05890 [Polyangiales bacterium]